jgi:multidrug efflux pump
MTLIDLAISRGRMVLATLALILIAGTYAYVTIPKESDPDINIPIIYVSLTLDGISPEDSERLLVRPMENELKGIEGVKEMRSTAFLGGGNVLLEFEAGFDPDMAIADVREKVDLAKSQLPADAKEPKVNEVNLSLFPVLVVTLGGDVPERTLLKLARDLRDKLETIRNVLEVTIGGDREELFEIILDPVRMQSYGLDAQALLAGINRANVLVAAGAIDTGHGRFAIKVPGLFESGRDILNLPLKVAGDAVVRVSDIADVRRSFKDRLTSARISGKPAVSLEISKRTGSNIIDTIAQVRAVVEAEKSLWPEEVSVAYSQDRSTDIRAMLTELQSSIIIAIILVMLVVVGALGLRSGFLVGIAIPGSFLAGILALSLMGLTINIVVLFSLILVVGMLVDDAIIVNEFADRKMHEGMTPAAAYSIATRRMLWPIVASTASRIAAFLPLLFWPGLVGEFMKFLPITLVATLTASLVMALLFIPVLGANLAPVARVATILSGIAAGAFGLSALGGFLAGLAGIDTAGAIGVALSLAGALIGAFVGVRLGALAAANLIKPPPVNETLRAIETDPNFDLSHAGGLTGFYVRVLKVALRHPSKILAGAVGVLVGSWALYGVFGRGVEFFPEVEPDQAIVLVHARGNLSVSEKNALTSEVEQAILRMQSERHEFETIYTTAGNLRSNDDDQGEDVIGRIQLELADWDKRRKADEIMADIRARTAHLAGIQVETRKPRAGPAAGKPVQVQLASRFPELLDANAARVRAFFDTLPGLVAIEDTRPMPGIEWEMTVDRAEAAKYNADIALIGSFIRLVTNGLKVSDYRPDDADDEIDIVVRYPSDYRTLDQLDRIRVQTSFGPVPISTFVERKPVPRAGQLRRVDQRRIMKVMSEVAPGVLADDKVQEVQAWLKTADIDPRVTVSFGGQDQDQNDAQAFLQKAFFIALGMIAIILLAEFNSFSGVLLVLSAVIMSTVGVMLGLLLIGQPFGIVMSGVGVIALAGVVVNNNIVLLDTYMRLKREIRDPMQAIIRTGAQRLRPVLLTAVTAVLGLLPMVFQVSIDFMTREVTVGAPSTQWWVQLSTAVAFGLSFATILTLIVTPCWLMVEAKIALWFARRRGAAEAPVPLYPAERPRFDEAAE